MSSERDIEYLAEWHPYLIDREFTGLSPERQLCKGRHRLDMMFSLRSGKCIVELKKTILEVDDVKQLVSYYRSWTKTHKLVRHHYLVGKRPEDLDRLMGQVKKAPFAVRLRFLGTDIPLALAWSPKEEKYIPYDDSAKSDNVIRFRF